MEYRKDIQMLRGIAVALVVLFHLNIPGFNSGFLGVDVFFVISGYLMAMLYDPADKSGFFVKRAKRLLPAYFAAVIITLLVALVVTVPSDYAQVVNQSVFAAFFASNIGFWMENSYFDSAAFKPLLHLWSLGVEIQFYLLVPLFCWLFSKTRIAYPLLLAGSALACFVVAGVSPKTSFFWLPFRLWEFLIGFGIAKHVYNKRNDTLAWIGFAAFIATICIPQIRVDGQALGFLRGHPGLVSLLISLTTAATLAFGVPKAIEHIAPSGALEKLGDYSYSIYLAHFPVIVLFLYQPFSGTIIKAESLGQTVELALLVIGGSALLYHTVEHPFRGKITRARWAIAAIISVLGIGQLGFAAQRLMTPAKEMLIYDALNDRATYRCGKTFRIVHPSARSCELSHISQPAHRVLLVGDSHADSIKETFTAAAEARNVAVYFIVENNPLKPGGLTARDLIMEARSRQGVSIVIHYSPGGVELSVINEMATLAEENAIHLSFIMPVPVWDRSIPAALLSKILPTRDIRDYRQANASLIDSFARVHFRVYETAGVFCRTVCMTISQSGKPFYFDGGHLTLTGSNLLRGVFDRVIADL